MLKKNNIFALTLFIVIIFIIAFNLTACTDTTDEPDNTDKITETSTSGENNSETDIDEQYNNIWAEMDFLITTDYPNGYDGAPVALGSDNCGRDKTGEMSISDMIDSIDNMGYSFMAFNLISVEGLYLRFSFNSDITPAEIKDVYYIIGNNETDRHYLDSFMKIPEEIGVYNFFVNLEWNDGTEEVVYFRVEVV
jgi:hypothetical protein